MESPSVPASTSLGGISHFYLVSVTLTGCLGLAWRPGNAPRQRDTDMSYRRGRSYRRAARLYRSHEERSPRARPALMIGFLAVVLGVGMAAVLTPRVRTVLEAS